MTPVTPETGDPQLAARAASTVEWLAKAGITLGGAWAFLAKVAKPYSEWRRDSLARTIREVLAPELQLLARVISQEDGCASRMEAVLEKLNDFFHDHDLLIDLSIDNRERHDETTELLNGLGLTSDRRGSEERRKRVEYLIDTLNERRTERRRKLDA